MPTSKYEEILERLIKALQRCDELGLASEASNSRFAQYADWLEKLIKIARAPVENRFSVENRNELSQHRTEYLASLVESMEFGDVMQNMQGVNSTMLVPKLKDILQGPFLPQDESATSNKSRNILFEMKLASLLKRAGFQPELCAHPDVRCSVDDAPFFFECKRPASEKKAEKRIKEAGAQLQEDVKRHGTSKTVVLSLSHSQSSSGLIRFLSLL